MQNADEITTYHDLEPNFDAFEGEPALNDTDWGYDTCSTNADHLREASVGDELLLNDRDRPLTVREVAVEADAGPYGRKRLFLQGNGCDYMIEVDLFHTRARFVLLDTGRATETRELGTLEWVIPDHVVNSDAGDETDREVATDGGRPTCTDPTCNDVAEYAYWMPDWGDFSRARAPENPDLEDGDLCPYVCESCRDWRIENGRWDAERFIDPRERLVTDGGRDDGLRVCTVVSCGKSKQDLEPGETVPARELYSSGLHTCKDRYGRHSDGYYIMSAEYGLVHNQTEIAEYDRRLGNMTDAQIRAWARDVAGDLAAVLERDDYDAVVLLGKADTYVGSLRPHFADLPAAVLTPWQTDDYVTGSGRGASWCNDESNWPENVESVAEIGEIVSAAPREV